jgi:hypothetical protein
MSAKRRDPESSETSRDIPIDELREFLAADGTEVNADPQFKEELREKLWDLVQSKICDAEPRGSYR